MFAYYKTRHFIVFTNKSKYFHRPILNPYGKELRAYNSAAEKYKSTYNERDLETGYDFRNARSSSADVVRFNTIDPMESKYPSLSTYNYVGGNPIRAVDPDGEDIVYFDTEGGEIFRISSEQQFKTYVQVDAGLGNECMGFPYGTYREAPMPGVVEGYEDAKYQQHDYVIAAQTFLFNQKLNNEDLPTHDDAHTIDMEQLPNNLDVDLVKAIAIEESQAGNYLGTFRTGYTDIMQVNNSGDWNDTKTRLGLAKGETMTPEKSVKAATMLLFWKGLESNTQGVQTWGGDWMEAARKYNGGGNPNYKEEVQQKYDNISPAKPVNY